MRQLFFYDIIDKKKKTGCLNLSFNLLIRNLNSKHHLYLLKHWEHLYQGNISGECPYEDGGEGGPKSNKREHRGEGGPNYANFVRT